MNDDPTNDMDPPGSDTFSDLERFRGPLTRFFSRRLKDPTETGDLVQDVFLRIVRRGPLPHAENFEGYVFRTAESAWLDRGRYRRSRMSDRHEEFDASSHAGQEPGVERIVSSRQELQMLTAALRELPERTQAVFLLRRLDGCSMSDIAARLGFSVSTVEKQMRRAMLHLLASGRDKR